METIKPYHGFSYTKYHFDLTASEVCYQYTPQI
jgi:hypothetical protein